MTLWACIWVFTRIGIVYMHLQSTRCLYCIVYILYSQSEFLLYASFTGEYQHMSIKSPTSGEFGFTL